MFVREVSDDQKIALIVSFVVKVTVVTVLFVVEAPVDVGVLGLL
jgi:hypothetical protein